MRLFIKNQVSKYLSRYCKIRYSSSDLSTAAVGTGSLYPPILDLSEKEVNRRNREEQYEKYRKLNTVEEKLFSYNLLRYYGWNSLILNEGVLPYNILPFYQHITRTKVYRTNRETFDSVIKSNREACKEVIRSISKDIQEAVLFELKGRRDQLQSTESSVKLSDSQVQNIVGQYIVNHINRIILSHLSSDFPHLLEATTDYQPRIEAFWLVGGFHPWEDLVKEREWKKLSVEEQNEKVEHYIQYLGNPCLQLRSKLPLNVLNTEAVSSEKDEPIPIANYDPIGSHGLQLERRHVTNIPGFWAGDENDLGLLSFHLCGHLMDRPPQFGPDDAADSLVSQAILASYAWLLAQASYKGFSTFHEVSYPLVNQAVITDGHCFSLYAYQLNTVLTHSDCLEHNPRYNVCLALPHEPLYRDIENNQFIGWNDKLIEDLLMFYLNKPEVRKDVDMTPNLHPEEKLLSDIEDSDRRNWLHQQFRHMYSNRPRARLPYEIYDWERIYKIRFETRPMDARTRPFELDSNPIEDRKYYHHLPPYIPRSQRQKKKHWTAWRAKFAKTYYPEVV